MRTFPIFVSFEGKSPLVVGGGELAAVKTRLLLKRAPSVDVAASEVVAELAALAEAGLVSILPALPGIDQLRGRPLVISATEDDKEDSRVSAIARALGVPVNVPDRPVYSKCTPSNRTAPAARPIDSGCGASFTTGSVSRMWNAIRRPTKLSWSAATV